MKSVVIKPKTIEIDVKDIDHNKIYAYCSGFRILRLGRFYDSFGFFLVFCSDKPAYCHDTIEDSIIHAINCKSADVKEFDTEKEFYEWALEQIS